MQRHWHPSQKNKKLKNGSLELNIRSRRNEGDQDLILGFGSLAKVLEPASLVEEVKENLAMSLKAYGVGRRLKSASG
jgi:predicted DNA-binding transcriptional regulator YafY